MNDPLVVGIMGAGRMAQGYDSPGDANILSHAHAIQDHPRLRLGGFYDCDEARAAMAEDRWSVPSTPRDRSAWLDQPWDVVCIATPDDQHAQDLSDVLDRQPRAVVVEKPLATDPDQAEHLLERARDESVAVLVDFPRRYHTGVAAVGALISGGRLGSPLAGSFVFSGTPAHSAVHMLDLFHTWWGDGWRPRLIGSGSSSAMIELGRDGQKVSINVTSLPSDHHYLWEMHIFCERGKITLMSSPEVLSVDLTGKHPVYAAVDVLAPQLRFEMESEPLLTGLMNAVVDAIEAPGNNDLLLDREIGSQRFSGGVLRLLQSAEIHVVDAASRCRA